MCERTISTGFEGLLWRNLANDQGELCLPETKPFLHGTATEFVRDGTGAASHLHGSPDRLQQASKGELSDADWGKISNSLGRLGDAPLHIADTPHLTIMEMRAKCRRLQARGEQALVILDYLQLMTPIQKTDNQVQEVSEISRSLKILARELNVPVVALSQLSRNVETRVHKRLLLADLRDSGALEADGDVVLLIYRDEIYNPETRDGGVAEINVAKHRNGSTGRLKLAFVDRYASFANLEPVE